MLKRLVVSMCAVLSTVAAASAGELTRGLTISGGQNSFATLTLERVNDPAAESGVLKLHVSLSETKNLKGYGFSLQFDPVKYAFLEARELEGNLLNAVPGQQTLFLSSSRTPGQLEIGAVKVDGQGASGEGKLVELVFRTNGTPASADFQDRGMSRKMGLVISFGVFLSTIRTLVVMQIRAAFRIARSRPFARSRVVPNSPATATGF